MQFPSPHSLVAPLLDVGSLPLVVLPLIVELAVLVRGVYTREPTDVVLAAVAVPCLLVTTWSLVERVDPSGVYWGGLFSAAAGGILVFLVAVDAVIGVAVRARATE